LINTFLFSGSFSKWAKQHNVSTHKKLPCINKLQKAVQEITAFILENNPLILRQRVEKQKKEDSSNDNKVLSVYLQEIEHRILEAIYEYCTKHKYVKKDCILCHDGITMPQSGGRPLKVEELHHLIKKQFQLSINLTVKPMKGITMEEIHNAIIHTPTQVKDTSSIFDVDITTDSIASHFAGRHKDKFVMQNKTLYHYNGAYWKCEETRGDLISINKFIREVYYNELSNELQEYERDRLKTY